MKVDVCSNALGPVLDEKLKKKGKSRFIVITLMTMHLIDERNRIIKIKAQMTCEIKIK